MVSKAALDALLNPRSVAVIGASDRANVGGRIYRNMLGCGFKGPLYPVNPNYATVGGVPCYADIDAVPKVPDCVAIALPFGGVLAPLEAAARRGVKAAVVVAEGFNDAGTRAGRARQARLSAIGHEYGMAISGPNSMGIVSLARKFATAFTNLPNDLETGGVSVISQSGGLVNATMEMGRNRGLGFNTFVSGGNEAVVTSADYIRWFADDPGTKVIVNILEGARDGRAYRDALAYATAKKPVVVLKLGRTDAGRAAAQAHTGSLAGSEAAYDSAIRDSGATAVTTIDEMIETTSLFTKAPIPKGDKVFIFSVSGGASVLAGDLARGAGLNLVPIPKATAKAFGKILGVSRNFANPMDVVGAPRLVKGDNLTRCLRVALRESRFDAIGFVLVVQRETSASHHGLHEQFRAIAPKARKPVVMISEMAWQPAKLPAPGGPALAGTLDVGLAALRHLVDYGAYRRAPQAKPPPRPWRRDLGLNGGAPLTEPESNEILHAAGIPLARWRVAESAAGAARAASQIGSPVAVKAVVRGLTHKTEAGAVRLDVSGPAAVRQACAAIAASLRRHNRRTRIEGFLVQEMVPAGVEMILGGRLDPQFGPIVLIGAGGTLAELAEDVAVGVAPLSRRDATRMVASLKVARLLQGFRGAPKADRRALIDLMVRFSRFLAATEGQIAEIDLNPVKVLAGNNGVRVVDSLIVPQSSTDRLE